MVQVLKYLSCELSLVVGGILLLILEVVLKKREKLLGIIAWGCILIAYVFLFLTPITELYFGLNTKILILDNFSRYFKGIFLLFCLLTVLISFNLLKKLDHPGAYLGLLLFATSGSSLLASCNELLSLYISLEILSISCYILVAILKEERATEAAIKYVIFGLLSSGIFLYGISLLYGNLQTTCIDRFVEGSALDKSLLILSILLILVGIGFKIGSFPFCFWIPDVYQGASSPIAGYISTVSKAAGLVILIRILFAGFSWILEEFLPIFCIISALTMAYGTTCALLQKDIKRMLGYSSIAHIGFMLIGISMGINQDLSAVLFYILVYGLANISIFAIAFNTEKLTNNNIENYAGLARLVPIVGFFMVIYLVSLTGIPPLAGFIGKFYLFAAAISQRVFWLAILGVIFSVVSIFYYFNILKEMYINEPKFSLNNGKLLIPLGIKIVCILSAILIIGLGIYPEILLKICRICLF
jgi:NADH-quinone oxidoreductase subunit N